MVTVLRNESFQPSQRAQSFEEIFFEPFEYADLYFQSAFGTQSVADSALQQRARFDFCATFIDLTSRVAKVIVGLILIVPLINIVALQILRCFNCSYVIPAQPDLPERPITSTPILNFGRVFPPFIPANVSPFISANVGLSGVGSLQNFGPDALSDEEMALDEAFRAMSNQGEVLIPQDIRSLPPATQVEYSQRKQDLLNALANPNTLRLENFRCVDQIGRFDLDAILARFRTDYSHTSLEEFFDYAGVVRSKRAGLRMNLVTYGSRCGLNPHQVIIKNCLSRLFDFLTQKKALFQNHQKEGLFKAEIRHIFDQICNAHLNCVDQVGSQIESIMIRTIAGYEAAQGGGSQMQAAILRSMAACALFDHKLQLVREICVKEYPEEPHFVVIEREAKRILANELGLNGDIVQAGAHYSSYIANMEMKARNVAEIFLHGRPLEMYQGQPTHFRRANRNYAADRYQPEKFLMGGSTLSYGNLISLGTSILHWATDYFKLGEEDAQTAQCIELISANNDGLTADMGGDLKPEAFLYFLTLLGIFERAA